MPTITFLLLAILAAIASGAHSPPIPKRFPAYNSVDARAAELFIMFHLVHCVCNEHRDLTAVQQMSKEGTQTSKAYHDTIFRSLEFCLAVRQRDVQLAQAGKLPGWTPIQQVAEGDSDPLPPLPRPFSSSSPHGVDEATLQELNDGLTDCVCKFDWINRPRKQQLALYNDLEKCVDAHMANVRRLGLRDPYKATTNTISTQSERPDGGRANRVEGDQGLMKFAAPQIHDAGNRLGHVLQNAEKAIGSTLMREGNGNLVPPPFIRGGGRPISVP